MYPVAGFRANLLLLTPGAPASLGFDGVAFYSDWQIGRYQIIFLEGKHKESLSISSVLLQSQ
jgi:hypothetical protein